MDVLSGEREQGPSWARANWPLVELDEALLTGLQVGGNVVKALLPDGSVATIVIKNHPNSGPVLAGPQHGLCAHDAA